MDSVNFPGAVVVHAGARDNYQLALALDEHNMLERLVTDFYCPDYLRSVFPAFAAKRTHAQLSGKKVSIGTGALSATLKMYIGRNFKHNKEKDLSLSKLAFKIARRKKAHLFCYSYYAGYAFSKPQAFAGQRKILFQLHPHPRSVRQVLEHELQRVPASADSIQYENEFRYSSQYLQYLSDESILADKIVVASTYTKRTLVEQGISEGKISVIPYGINSTIYYPRKAAPDNKKLRIIFVGSMIQRKGLSDLLDAVSTYAEEFELVLCGRGFMDVALIDSYKGINLTIKRNLTVKELVQELHQSDLFVLPTLSEGFAQVILEAMSCGLPVITTDNSCGPDVITENVDGWIIPIRSPAILAERLFWCVKNKETLFRMGIMASKKASLYTWERFRTQIFAFYKSAL